MNMESILEIIVISSVVIFFFGVVLYLSNLAGCLSRNDERFGGNWLRTGM